MDAFDAEPLPIHAKQAESYANILGQPAMRSSKDTFHQKVAESLEYGDSWVHKWTRNTPACNTVGGDGYTTEDPQIILTQLTEQWSTHWHI